MSEIKITLGSLENAILRDGLFVSGYVSSNGYISADGNGAHAEGYAEGTQIGDYLYTGTIGAYSKGAYAGGYTIGGTIKASGDGAIAYGYVNIGNIIDASGVAAHAEGINTLALAEAAYAIGKNTKATGIASYAEGYYTIASAKYSHAAGKGTIATEEAQTAIGKYNASDENALFIIGNGSQEYARSNAVIVANDETDINNDLYVSLHEYVGNTIKILSDVSCDSSITVKDNIIDIYWPKTSEFNNGQFTLPSNSTWSLTTDFIYSRNEKWVSKNTSATITMPTLTINFTRYIKWGGGGSIYWVKWENIKIQYYLRGNSKTIKLFTLNPSDITDNDGPQLSSHTWSGSLVVPAINKHISDLLYLTEYRLYINVSFDLYAMSTGIINIDRDTVETTLSTPSPHTATINLTTAEQNNNACIIFQNGIAFGTSRSNICVLYANANNDTKKYLTKSDSGTVKYTEETILPITPWHNLD